MSEPSGRLSPQPFALFDHDLCCWKTYLQSLALENCPEPVVTWPKQGTWDVGAAYELPTSVPPTAANACSSLLPTPRVSDTNGAGTHGDGGPEIRTAISILLPTPQGRDGDHSSLSPAETAHLRHHEQGKRNLDDAIALLPTPAARDHKGLSARKPLTLADGSPSPAPCRNNQLPDAVHLLPTPRATDGEKGGPNQRGSSGDLMLPSAVMLFPTPTASRVGHNQSSSPGAAVRPSLDQIDKLLPTPTASTGPDIDSPSPGGKPSSDDQHPPRLF